MIIRKPARTENDGWGHWGREKGMESSQRKGGNLVRRRNTVGKGRWKEFFQKGNNHPYGGVGDCV